MLPDLSTINGPSLTRLADLPELVVQIDGLDYSFSELPLGTPERRGDPPYGLAALQDWIGRNLPHPLDALRGHLDGMPTAVAAALAENARQEARGWPPQVGTGAGAAALMGSHRGQVEALYWGLKVHHPETTREQAVELYRALERESLREARRARQQGRQYDGEGLVRRIFAVLFGLEDPGDDLPKARPGTDGPNGESAGT